MEAHDLRAALDSLPALSITPSTTDADAKAAFAKLDEFNNGGVFVGSFSGETPWERHRGGDELVHVLQGEVEITILTETGAERLTLRTGSVVVVPRGLWHRQHARVRTTLLTATPTPTDTSLADDPRADAGR